jgi:hypothetical protein
MARKIDEKTRRAYEAGGWGISPVTGKAIPPVARLLSPSRLAPPGFSKLPAPKRRWRDDRPMPEVPERAKSVSEIPAGLREAYDSIPGVGYLRNVVGDVLHDYRSQKVRDPLAEPLVKRRTLTKQQYTKLQGLATPGAERQNFLRAAATRRITVEG